MPAGVAVVSASMSLRTIIRLRQQSGHPVVLVDEGGFCGICDEAEIVRGLAGGVDARDGAA
jgi:glycine betaine/proline transport system ATP-binding protein